MHTAKLAAFCGVLLLGLSGLCQATEPNVDILRNQVFVERDSGPLAADIYRPRGPGPFPAILVVHGGAWRMGTRADLAAIAQALAAHGYTAVAIDYRLAPKYKFPAQIYDCQAAVRWMRAHASELKIDPNRIGGFGYSAGGHLVALLGTLDDKQLREPGLPPSAPSARLQVIVAGGAPCDFRVLPGDSDRVAFWIGGTRDAMPNEYRDASPASFITSDDPPMYFFHGQQDLLVPIQSPTEMVKQLKDAHVTAEMYPIKDAGHIQALFDRSALEHGLAFADKYLLKNGDTVAKTGALEASNAAAKADLKKPTEASQTGGGM
jgi:acetyl esterase/lipase